MIPKNSVISILFVGVMILGTVSCGSDEEKHEVSTTERPIPVSSKGDLLGSWEVVLINGMDVKSSYQSLAREEGVEAKVKQFNCVFAADDSWTWKYEHEFVSDEPPLKVEVIAAWSGTYVVKSSTLTLVIKEEDVKITIEPQEEDFEPDKQVFTESIKPIEQATGTIQGDRLTLTTPDGKIMVFKKQ